MNQKKCHSKAALDHHKTANSIPELIQKTKNYHYAKWIKTIADKPGILTHQLIEYECFSNNHHIVSKCINNKINQLGWKIIKIPLQTRFTSWSWYLVQIEEDQI